MSSQLSERNWQRLWVVLVLILSDQEINFSWTITPFSRPTPQ
jgi:hypothetical protein